MRVKELLDDEHLNSIMSGRNSIGEITKENIFKIQEENRKTYIIKKEKQPISTSLMI